MSAPAELAPHSLQKRAPAGRPWPHCRQVPGDSAAPQLLQNLPDAEAPQAEQVIEVEVALVMMKTSPTVQGEDNQQR